MAKVIGKQQLCSTELKYFKAVQGIDGKALFARYESLDNIIKKNINPEFQDFIAFPETDGDRITFYGKKYFETPLILADLQGSDLLKYKAIKEETLSHYSNKIIELKGSGKASEADFLTGATKFIDDRFVYCYDNIVVLGVWGMQLRENLLDDISEIRKNLAVKKRNLPPGPVPVFTPEPPISQPVEDPEENVHIQEDPPQIPPISPEPTDQIPWYIRFWRWLQSLFLGRGCLKWLLWLLLLLLLLFLLTWLFRSCDSGSREYLGGEALSGNDSTWIKDDPNVGKGGGKYDPINPYQPLPTPPGYENILPPQQGVLPPNTGEPDIIPGNPSILGNRLNILMENEDKSIMDFARDFKAKYLEDKYQVVYYDDVVKRIQIEIPKEERERLKEEIPEAFAPDYDLFVFDESLFEGNSLPNDPALSDNDKSWYLDVINAPKAWEITKGSEKITVAIVDNGFNLKHPELASKVVGPYNVWKHSNEVYPQDIDHGTHVAGIALAIADNGKGISGIAPGCKFMPVQVADEQGIMTTTSVLDGILYSLYQGADVVNISLGGQFEGISEIQQNEQEDLIQNHFKEEERLWRRVMRIAANHNSTLVIAAGNDNVLAGIDAIQRPELFITVSAIGKDQKFNKAQFSNYGNLSTISAPGVGIYSTVGENDYKSMDGTSMAAPIVSGSVALMKSINDTITTKQIICILQTTGLDTQGNIGNLIQLDKSLQLVNSGEQADCTPTPSTGDVQILLSWNNFNDLDLICTDPNGESIFYGNRNAKSGGQLEIDMNVEYPDSKTPIENIYWKPSTAPNGTYHVYVQYYKKHESGITNSPYTVTIKYDGKTENYSGNLTEEKKSVFISSFSLGRSQKNNDRKIELEKEKIRLQQELERINKELKKIENFK
ncbi:MAG: S8 family serine peptidase [Algoriphagus aquaeductus]|uniref:S8 family serine peptidase n=1 Tax=Algoriphagus aquaeductus TaxID=475299 RepID=UPI00391AD31B